MSIAAIPYNWHPTSAWWNDLIDAVNATDVGTVDDLRDDIEALETRIGGTWRRVANQSVATATATIISWDTEDVDTDGLASVPTGTITIPDSGVWTITAVLFGLAGTAPTVRITVAGSIVHDFAASLFSGNATATIVGPLDAGTTFTVSAYQNSGSAQNVTGRLHVYKVGP